jgi:hypothetical protein
MSESSRNDQAPGIQRRKFPRVPGPFNGTWLGALSVEIRIHDLSMGGCLIHSYNDVPPGRRLMLELDLPFEGRIAVTAETLYIRPDYGFAVKFIEMTDETRARLEAVIQRLLAKSQAG